MESARSTTAMDCGKGRQNMKARYLAFSLYWAFVVADSGF